MQAHASAYRFDGSRRYSFTVRGQFYTMTVFATSKAAAAKWVQEHIGALKELWPEGT